MLAANSSQGALFWSTAFEGTRAASGDYASPPPPYRATLRKGLTEMERPPALTPRRDQLCVIGVSELPPGAGWALLPPRPQLCSAPSPAHPTALSPPRRQHPATTTARSLEQDPVSGSASGDLIKAGAEGNMDGGAGSETAKQKQPTRCTIKPVTTTSNWSLIPGANSGGPWRTPT